MDQDVEGGSEAKAAPEADNGGRMKIEIWSDVMCPFCYIGKRRFEKAMEQFPARDEVQVVWKSFQLDPDIDAPKGRSLNEYLAERKGWTLEHARKMNEHVTGMARESGLDYRLDMAVVADSFDAHRLVQMAKSKDAAAGGNRADAVEENLFMAYFTEGKDIADHAVLEGIAEAAGLEATEVRAMLAGDAFSDAVKRDALEARQVGVTGVPFFVLDRRYAISGAHDSDTFLGALEQAYRERKASAAGKVGA
jgi:predicted DsbA family dithiol-disulfide isomerase